MCSIMTNGQGRKILLKEGSIISTTMDRDAGFCSAEEDYLEHDLHSPTDSSEDSVEVKVSPISLRNKRKCAEPRKVQDIFSGPLKKRVCLKVKTEEALSRAPEAHPFRPWSTDTPEQPVPLIKKCPEPEDSLRVPVHPQVNRLSFAETEKLLHKSVEVFPNLQVKAKSEAARKEQRNYKNMTRERRIEANARERTRVHTISAAFETLRRSVPSYSHNQKLSKLSVLRIACSYIMTLSSLVSEDGDGPSPEECVENVSRTIQREGKLRKKKDESD